MDIRLTTTIQGAAGRLSIQQTFNDLYCGTIQAQRYIVWFFMILEWATRSNSDRNLQGILFVIMWLPCYPFYPDAYPAKRPLRKTVLRQIPDLVLRSCLAL